jgi:hypothetical protein
MAWTRVGSITVRPESDVVRVGVIEVPPQGGIELMVRQVSPYQGFNFAYGLVSFRSPLGRELGTVKCWPGPEWTAFALGEGLSSLSRAGELLFEPRSYNLRWVKAGFPWSVEFMADIGFDLPQDRVRVPGFVNTIDILLPLVKVGTQGRIQF